MKFILCQPAIKRFEWELEVVITNLKNLGAKEIVLLFAKWDDSIPKYFKDNYNVEVHVYDDSPRDKRYIPSVKPYLWWKYLEEDSSREIEDYFYIDSDVIFREIPNLSNVDYNSNKWVGSDCAGYLGIEYIDSKGKDLLSGMCKVIGIKENVIRENQPIAGAQWIIAHPTAEYWKKVYQDSIKLYQYLNSIEKSYIKANDSDYTPIQKWTAEMWAQLWNVYYFDKKTRVSDELDFTWATDPIEKWYENKIYHNAGVTSEENNMFFKGKYVDKTPFHDNLENINNEKACYKYVEAIKQVER